jgi:hypothetical protein
MRRAGMSPANAHNLRLIDAAAVIAAGEDGVERRERFSFLRPFCPGELDRNTVPRLS